MKASFLTKLSNFYKENKRDFEWRNTHNPYKILVSEIMLQQKQTKRVVEKYEAFIKEFPTIQDLAKAPQARVLELWQGLGYNRRALYLKRAAELLTQKEEFPKTITELTKLPGIGKNTAGAVLAFAFNIPTIFIETNIRRVYIHEFFKDKVQVKDTEILTLIEKTIDEKNPREFYYALMDYGSYLGKNDSNANRKSRHYKIQSKFNGSIRQTRGEILKPLISGENDEKHLEKIINSLHFATARDKLIKEGFIVRNGKKLQIKS